MVSFIEGSRDRLYHCQVGCEADIEDHPQRSEVLIRCPTVGNVKDKEKWLKLSLQKRDYDEYLAKDVD